MKNSTVLAAVMAMGLAFHAQAKTYTPVFTEDFESASPFASGWTWYGSAHEQAERTLIDGTTTSNFLHITGTKYERGDFSFNSDCTALTDYRLEFDWFANMGYGGKTCRLICYAGESELFHVADPNPGNERTSYLYINGADTTDTANAVATFTSAERGADCTGASNQKYWYHITVTANETDGVFLKIASQDSSVGTVYNARISDFTHVTKIAFTADSKGYNTNGGIDDIVFSRGTSESFVWTGANGNNTWSTPGNWTVDGVPQTENYPVLGDTATIGDDITVAVEAGAVLPSVTLGDSSALSFDVSGFAEKTAQRLLAYCGSTLASSQIALTGITASDYAVEYETTDEGAVYATLWPKTYFVWSGNGSDTLWTTIGNWVYGNGDAAESCPGDGATVVFPSSLLGGATVTLNADASAAEIVVDAAVSLDSAGTTRRIVYPGAVSGSGGLTIGNIRVQTPTFAKVEISCDIAVADSAASFYLRGANAKMTLSGALAGSGTLNLDADTNGGHSYAVTGDLSGFSGTLEIPEVLRNGTAGCSYDFNGADSTIDLSGATVSIADPMTMTLGGTYDNNILKIGALTGAGTINNNTANAMTLQVGNDETDAESSAVLSVADGTGAWTVAKTGANTQSLTDATVAYDVSVSGGTLKLPVGKALGTVAVSGGALGFAADGEWVDDTPYTLFTYSSWTDPSSTAITLDQSELDVVHSVAYDFATPGTVALTLSEAVFVWNGGASGYWDDASNWLLNGSVTASAPSYQNKVTIDGAIVYADASAELTGVTLSNDAKIALMFTDDALTFTIPSGLAATDFVAAGPYTMEESDGVLNATRVAATFTWTGGASGEWTDAANWTVGGGYTAALPSEDDAVIFGSAASVTFGSNAYAASVALGGDVEFSDGWIKCPLYTGDGRLSIDGMTLTAPTTGHFNINVDVEAVDGSENVLTLEPSSTSGSDYRYIYITGDLTGSGRITLNSRSKQGLAGGKFSGDNREFRGVIDMSNYTSPYRGTTSFIGENSTSSNAVYTVYGRADGRDNVFASANTTYRLGALNGSVYQQSSNGSNPTGITLEIGNLNKDCTFGGDLGSNKTAIRKVGTAKLTCSAGSIGNVEIAGGTYEVTKNTQSGNITFTGNGIFRSTPEASASKEIDYAKKFVGSTDFPIVFDDGDTNRTWSSAIPASNTAGFTKLGTGTLTLEQAPKYTGWTTVKAGKLIVPSGTALDVVAGAGGEIEGATTNNLKFASGYTLTAGEESHVATGTADVSNLTVNIANPASAESITIVRAGSITGTATLAFPAGTSEKVKAKWSLRSGNGTLKASSVVPFAIIVR